LWETQRSGVAEFYLMKWFKIEDKKNLKVCDVRINYMLLADLLLKVMVNTSERELYPFSSFV